MLFYHGTADPIFSSLDTIRYIDELKARYGDSVPDFARLFLVPGMNHCTGGPATDQFDPLSALDKWVETGAAPDMLLAATRSVGTPWPGRTRPLCAWPKVATYRGAGDIEQASSFECR